MGIQKDKLTENQKQELERLRNFVSRNRLASHMNGTKWRAAIDAVLGLEGYRPSFRYKALLAAGDPPEAIWDESFPKNIPLYNSMEWLEFNAWSAGIPRREKKGDCRLELKRVLEAARIPILETAAGIRILAYTKS
jgi:hypothetical protein